MEKTKLRRRVTECFCLTCMAIGYSERRHWINPDWVDLLQAPCLSGRSKPDPRVGKKEAPKLTRSQAMERLWKSTFLKRNARVAHLLRQAIIDRDSPFWKERYEDEKKQ